MVRINLQLIIFVTIYSAILSLIFFGISPFFGIGLLALCFLGLGMQSLGRTILLPFYLFPFMFLIRAQSPDNPILAILPDLFVALSIALNVATLKIRKKNMSLLGLIALLSILISSINLYHVGELSYLPLIIRQYTLPLLFLLVVINSSLKNPGLHEEALRISIVSFSLVAILSLLNIAGIIFIPRSLEALYPFLNFIENTDNIKQISRTIGSFSFPRLNLFTGGALGSSGALFFILGLVALFNIKFKLPWVSKVLAIPLIISSLVSLSTSLIFAVIGYCIAFYFLVRGHIKYMYVGVFALLSIVFMLSSISVFNMSPIEYFMETSLGGFTAHFFSLDFSQLMFGVGPRFTSAGYEFVPDKFIVDAGIFRVFIESGLIAFIMFLAILVNLFLRGFYTSFFFDNSSVRPFIAIFLVFIFLVHANMTALPPFYPLFCAACLGMHGPKIQKNKI